MVPAEIIERLRSGFLRGCDKMLIGGRWVAAADGGSYDVVDPSTGTAFAKAAVGRRVDVDLAVAAARRAFEGGPWPAMSPADRSRLLWRLADAIEAHADELAVLESLNTGKPLRAARAFDVTAAIESARYNAGWATKIGGITQDLSLPGEWHSYTMRVPVGVVGQIVAFNVPLAMAVNKIAPALAAGCTVVLKPAEQTPLTALRLGQLLDEVGFPPGVVNIVTGPGSETGEALVAHPDVDKISFTGSTAVGRAILSAVGGNMKRVTLELGGKSPAIVFPDADIDRATDAVTMGVFFNAGQVCAAASRLFVHRSVFDRVVEGVAERAVRLRLGEGLAVDTDIGPVISRRQQERVLGYVESGRREGARVLVGGKAPDRSGFFVEPTVLVGVRPEMTVMREEIFGPVLCAMPFDEEDLAAIAQRANDTVYGLSSSIWTRDLSLAHRLARLLKAANVRINAAAAPDPSMPFGGFKQSGWGKENGREGVESYTEVKAVAVCL